MYSNFNAVLSAKISGTAAVVEVTIGKQDKLQRFTGAACFFQCFLYFTAVFRVSRVNQDEAHKGCCEVTVYATKTDSFCLNKSFFFALYFRAVIKPLYLSQTTQATNLNIAYLHPNRDSLQKL